MIRKKDFELLENRLDGLQKRISYMEENICPIILNIVDKEGELIEYPSTSDNYYPQMVGPRTKTLSIKEAIRLIIEYLSLGITEEEVKEPRLLAKNKKKCNKICPTI